jgi:hypothetical protein
MVHQNKSTKKGKKAKYRIRNWKEYNEALVNRGRLTLWITEEALKTWNTPDSTGKRGAPTLYSNIAIQTCLTMKEVFHLDLRKTEGFISSLFEIKGLNLRVPDHSTLSLRAKNLSVSLKDGKKPKKPITDIVIDSTGVKVYGEGEWKVRQHGKAKKRTWRKIHVSVDPETGDIIVEKLTTNDVTDAEVLPHLLTEEMVGAKARLDGAYDKRKCYEVCNEKQVIPIVPPQKNARIWKHGNAKGDRLIRDQALRRIRKIGRKKWKEEIGYHLRSLAETTMFRLKAIFSDKLRSRAFSRQETEMAIRCRALNIMTSLGIPDSYMLTA